MAADAVGAASGGGAEAFAPNGWVTLTSDFGLRDGYAGMMKGVMATLQPGLRFIDLSHDLAAQDVRSAAFLLWQAVPCFAAGTVHLAVVDPGVGSERAAVVVVAGGHALIGPDNGLLWPAVQRLGGGEWRRIENRAWRREPFSRTFHGRDLFAPAAARLAGGAAPVEVGPLHPCPVRLEWPRPHPCGPAAWEGEVLAIDRFGNAVTNLCPGDLGIAETAAVWVLVGDARARGLAACYREAPPNTPFALVGSAGLIEIAVREGNAASALGLCRGSRVCLETGTNDR